MGSSAADDAVTGWQEGVAALRQSVERVDTADQIALLAETLAAFAALERRGEPERALLDAFSWSFRGDGVSDGILLYEVAWHGARLGELFLAIQPLPDALDSPGWVFSPGPPLALPSQLLVVVGDEPDTTDLLAWLRSIVDPATVEHTRIDVAQWCLDRLRIASHSDASSWLAHLHAPSTPVLRYRREASAPEEPPS